MADTYPWGAAAPVKRVATIEGQIATNDKKRSDVVEAHKKRLAEFDETDRRLKADLKQATSIVEREQREATVAAATKALEKVLASMASSGVDLDEIVRNGDFEKVLGKSITEATAKEKPAKKTASAVLAEPSPDGASTDPVVGDGDGASSGEGAN